MNSPKRWGEGRGHWYQREGAERRMAWLMTLGTLLQTSQTSSEGPAGPCFRRDALAGQSLQEEGVSLQGPGRILERGGQLEKEPLCGGYPPNPNNTSALRSQCV